ncbi:MAG: SBBP repeat-containing protein [Ignavibacteria bacterium]|nr:SBBP repeat-containing protein [Ignavibacteria bacterium]
MKNIFTILVLLTAIESAPAQVTQEWVARYNGPGNSNDRATSIAVDGSGNIYVTGNSRVTGTGDDYATIKYNSSGVQQWVRIYNGSGDSTDYALSIAVDGSGNVYVTGLSTGSGTGYDYATIKYNSSGDLVWVKRYNGPGNSFDVASSIAVDGTGNVYVTGYSNGNRDSLNSTGLDYATIKYNSSGDSVWVKRYNGSGNFEDIATSIVVDDLGNVYITGYTGSEPTRDFVTIKYNSSGDSVWVKRYNGPGNSTDQSFSIAVDGSGNVYVTGEIRGSETSYDYATIKYNSSGDSIWIRKYNGPGNYFDEANSIVVDDSGNVFVTGRSNGVGTNFDYATIKYNSLGDSVWVKRYNGPGNVDDNATSIAVDGSGNVYVTGSSSGLGTGLDYATIKYNSSGDSVWVKRYNGPGNYYDEATSIAVDGYGNVYVTGSSGGIGSGADYATIKYSQSTGIGQISSNIPEEYSLSQNYPNPFNPATNLEFGISDLGFVSLKVYDILGKEIITLVNEKLSPGNYKVEFDGRGLTSGVYFYRLNTGEFTDTKRMILIK